jgi:radical SAM protein (TIGR01212 family)
MAGPPKRYYDLNTYLRNTFGCRVQKITVDAGFTCPNRDGSISSGGCIYCNENGSGTGAFHRGLSISDQLIAGKERLFKRYRAKKYIAYFQSFTNTYAPIETLRKVYEEALAVEDIVGLSIGTRPDCVDEPILNLLQGYARRHLIWIEYGLQSAHDDTLRAINRGHDAACFQHAVQATQNRGIKICAHVILGLPGEDREHILETAEFIAKLGIDGLKLHLLYIIQGTALEKLYQEGRYQCLSQEAYVDLVCDFLERIPKQVIIQRLTGDPHPHELVAPQWSLRKAETLARIKKSLEDRDTWQGRLLS